MLLRSIGLKWKNKITFQDGHHFPDLDGPIARKLSQGHFQKI